MSLTNDLKFTPGPWAIGDNFSEYGLTDNDGGIPIIGNSADPDKRGRIATALTTKHFPRGKTYKAIDPERDANAALIAAAPTLHSELMHIRDYANKQVAANSVEAALWAQVASFASAAIAKASAMVES